MASYVRCGLIRSLGRRYTSGVLTFDKLLRNSRLLATVPQRDDAGNLALQIHKKIDYNVGISSELFSTFYSSLIKFDSLTEKEVGLLLHICSEGPFDLPVKKRQALVDEIWKKICDLGIEPTTRLFNIKLRTYCNSKKLFNPLDELMNMKSLGLNPDMITYQLLIEGFCQKGDVNGANCVLETLNMKNYLLNVNNFNSFITGHLKAGSPEEAVKVFDLLRSKGLHPTPETYFNFAVHYADAGDIESVMKYVHEAEAANVPLQQRLLLDLYQVMVTSGHQSKTGELLSHASNVGLFNGITIQKSCQLLSEGFRDAAFDLYQMIQKVPGSKTVYHTGTFLFRTMILNDQSAQEIMTMAEKVQEITPKSLVYLNSLLFSYKHNKPDLALQLVELMHSKNHPIKYPYILPALCSYRNNNNKDGVYKAVKMLIEMITGEEGLEQLLHCAYPALLSLNQTNEEILAAFKGHEKLWKTIFFCSDISFKGYTEALKTVQSSDILPITSILSSSVNRAKEKFLESEVESCVLVLDLIAQLHGERNRQVNNLVGDILMNIVANQNWSLAEKFIELAAQKNLKVNSAIHSSLSLQNGLPANIRNKLAEISEKSTFNRGRHLYEMDKVMMDAPIELLYNNSTRQKKSSGAEKVGVAELRSRRSKVSAKDKTSSAIDRLMVDVPAVNQSKFSNIINIFNKALKNNDLEELKHRQRELQATGFVFKPMFLRQYLQKLIELGDVDTASSLFEELRKNGSGNFDKSIPLLLGAELLKRGNVEGALDMVKATQESQVSSDELFYAINAILMESPNMDAAEKVHQAILKHKVVSKTDAAKVHQSYMATMLLLGDSDEFMRYLMKLYQDYKVFPNSERIFMRFITKKDVDRLKRVIDVGHSVYGNNYIHHLLAFSFIQSDLPAKAAVVLQTPGLRLIEKVIFNKCQYYIRQKKIDWLAALVDITKAMPISKSKMLSLLAEGYLAVEDLSKATAVIQEFLNDFIDPPKDLIQDLITAHKKANKELPEILQVNKSGEKPILKSESN